MQLCPFLSGDSLKTLCLLANIYSVWKLWWPTDQEKTDLYCSSAPNRGLMRRNLHVKLSVAWSSSFFLIFKASRFTGIGTVFSVKIGNHFLEWRDGYNAYSWKPCTDWESHSGISLTPAWTRKWKINQVPQVRRTTKASISKVHRSRNTGAHWSADVPPFAQQELFFGEATEEDDWG